jgi:hypothetical protein
MIDLAERTRAAEIGDLLQSLDLPATRLSEGQLATVAVAVASRPFLFEDLVIDDVERRWWMLLHRAANYEISVQSWERDQSSDWHDHGGSSGVLAVTSGVLLERYRDTDGVTVASRSIATGQHRTFGPAHVHDVVYEAGRPAVSIHAYSPPLSGLTHYEQTPYGFVAREVIPEDWGDLRVIPASRGLNAVVVPRAAARLKRSAQSRM